jgi:hypothetical protein
MAIHETTYVIQASKKKYLAARPVDEQGLRKFKIFNIELASHPVGKSQ